MGGKTGRIGFQGTLGSYSHQACVEAFPGWQGVPCVTFEGAIAAVREGRAELAMLPVENSTYGRVFAVAPELRPMCPRTDLTS